MLILNCLIPIFAVIGLGVVLRKRGFLNHDSTRTFNRFAYFFGLPVFLFYKLTETSVVADAANKYLVTLLATSMLTAIASWCVGYVLRSLPRGSRGALIQGGFRGNLAFISLPLIFFATQELPGPQRIELESAVLVALAPTVIFYNIVAVAVLAIYHGDGQETPSWTSLLRNIFTNPILLGCAIGVSVQSLQIPIPTAIGRTCDVVGRSAFPIALLGIGSQLASISVAGQLRLAVLASALKCGICPVIGWCIGSLMGLDGIALQVILLMCAAPTAISSFVLADQMKADSSLAASVVVVSTLCSLISLSVVLALKF